MKLQFKQLADARVITTTATLIDSDVIVADTSGAGFTITLPTSPGTGETIVAYNKGWATTKLPTFDAGTKTFDGTASTTYSPTIDMKSVTFVYDGASWRVYPTGVSASNQPFKDVFVSPSGNDTTGDGTILKPLATIAAGVTLAGNGGTVFLMPGNYTVGNYTMAGAGITIRGFGADGTSPSGRTNIDGFFTESNGTGWTFMDLAFSNGDATYGLFRFQSGVVAAGSTTTFKRCAFNAITPASGANAGRCVFLAGAHNVLFENCRFNGYVELSASLSGVPSDGWRFIDSIGPLAVKGSATTSTPYVYIKGCDELSVYDNGSCKIEIDGVRWIKSFGTGNYAGTKPTLAISNSSFYNVVTATWGVLNKSDTGDYIFHNVILPTTVTSLSGTNVSPNKKVNINLANMQDVDMYTTVPAANNILKYNGSRWVPGAGASGVTVSDTPPASPSNGDLWFESDTFDTYIYYNDGTTGAWVKVNATNTATTALRPYMLYERNYQQTVGNGTLTEVQYNVAKANTITGATVLSGGSGLTNSTGLSLQLSLSAAVRIGFNIASGTVESWWSHRNASGTEIGRVGWMMLSASAGNLSLNSAGTVFLANGESIRHVVFQGSGAGAEMYYAAIAVPRMMITELGRG